MLPMLDPRLLTQDQADELAGLFETVAARPMSSVEEDLRDPDRQAFDLWAMRHLVGPETQSKRPGPWSVHFVTSRPSGPAGSPPDASRSASRSGAAGSTPSLSQRGSSPTTAIRPTC